MCTFLVHGCLVYVRFLFMTFLFSLVGWLSSKHKAELSSTYLAWYFRTSFSMFYIKVYNKKRLTNCGNAYLYLRIPRVVVFEIINRKKRGYEKN